MRTRRRRNGGPPGRARRKLAALLDAMFPTHTFDPADIWQQAPYYASPLFDCCTWGATGNPKTGTIVLSVSSWSSMTSCARYGIERVGKGIRESAWEAEVCTRGPDNSRSRYAVRRTTPQRGAGAPEGTKTMNPGCAHPGCTADVNDDNHCAGCNHYVCEGHDLNTPIGQHRVEAHWTDDDDEGGPDDVAPNDV